MSEQAFFTAGVDSSTFIRRMQAMIQELIHPSKLESTKPVVWMPHPDGINSVVAHELTARGFDVRYLQDYGCLRKAAPSEIQASEPQAERWPHNSPSKSPAQSGKPDPSEDQAAGAKTTGQPERQAGDPSQTPEMIRLEGTIGESLHGISSGITLNIGVLNVNFQGSGEVKP